VLIGGAVAEVEESLKAGLETAPDALSDYVHLPHVHPEVVRALAAGRNLKPDDALGIVETSTASAAILAADRGIKGADVNLIEIRLADGLGGKGITFFSGSVSDVEAALGITGNVLTDSQNVRQIVIPQLHPEIAAVIDQDTRFGPQLGWFPA
jgi:microcompartment protein CcmL/EutN